MRPLASLRPTSPPALCAPDPSDPPLTHPSPASPRSALSTRCCCRRQVAHDGAPRRVLPARLRATRGRPAVRRRAPHPHAPAGGVRDLLRVRRARRPAARQRQDGQDLQPQLLGRLQGRARARQRRQGLQQVRLHGAWSAWARACRLSVCLYAGLRGRWLHSALAPPVCPLPALSVAVAE